MEINWNMRYSISLHAICPNPQVIVWWEVEKKRKEQQYIMFPDWEIFSTCGQRITFNCHARNWDNAGCQLRLVTRLLSFLIALYFIPLVWPPSFLIKRGFSDVSPKVISCDDIGNSVTNHRKQFFDWFRVTYFLRP